MILPAVAGDKVPHVITTKIKSNFIDITRQDQTIYFSGKVILEREDISMLADKMTVYYDQNQSDSEDSEVNNAQSIKKIVAKDNVKIFNQEFVATGKSGLYIPKEHNITLEDDVIFNNGTSLAHGQKFIYDLTTKKGHLFGIKDDKKTSFEKNEIKENNKEDNRVIEIIDDQDAKESQDKSKK
jgi:lipopolysaccharide transport protein LptA